MIEEGSPFPSFSLPDQDGKVRTLADFEGKKTLFYFYPKDDTSGCTAQACDLRDSFPKFKGVHVVGVSPDSPKSHRKFIDKYSLPFPLLADEEKALCEACGVWVEKSMYGKKYMGVERSSFLVDETGVVTHVWRKVKPAEHAEQVLETLKG
ncbi:MAG: thioredoxin-dependent thiol peroxidase [Fimbriimonadaceae bacterium]|nr:thioredoxin-dependent thiol peroxidase [Chthonomonadaceae bacterium]MCO5296514.1 thioredoxin-dependent thiol peroxidase [Fimbriimonadaceae bacterium]